MFDLKRIQAEADLRATKELSLKRMIVDYYRVRYKVSYAIPVEGDFFLGWQIRISSLPEYLWSIWLLWRLEERFYTLASKSINCVETQKQFTKELEVFSQWKTYRQLDNKADLSTGHSGRIFFTAYNKFEWLSASMREKLKEGAKRLVDESSHFPFQFYLGVDSKDSLLCSEKPWSKMHNIPLIGAIGVYLCMVIVDDDRKDKLLNILESVIEAIMDFSHANDYSEGVAYDGYIFDFLVDLYPFMSKSLQEKLKSHPALKDILVQSYALSVPGDFAHVAEIGDVEPFEMTFHHSACLRWQAISPDPEVQFYLNRLDAKRLPSLALFDAIRSGVACEDKKPKIGFFKLPATVCLRSGWGESDYAVGISCSKSTAGHIQYDAGTLTFGTKGFWFLDDPGYQQYMNTSEREFTYSKTAHNCPLINDIGQTQKLIKLESKEEKTNSCQAVFDLSRCYEIENLECKRQVHLNYDGQLTVIDRLNQESDLTYYWHFNRNAGLYVEDGKLIVDINGTILTVSCLSAKIEGKHLLRMKGSRGQVTLNLNLKGQREVEWKFQFS